MTIEITDKTYNGEFVKKIEEIGGKDFHKCMQCGTCTGSCPMTYRMDISPRKIIHLSKFGLKEKVSGYNTAWICASCHSCEVRCPRSIDIPKIMEAIRQVTLRQNINYIEPSEISEDILHDLPQIALVGCFRKHTS
ncbi:MAG: 4Fe-4S dicluster domain-containing protein [Thermodesulfobacteriota bacterium]|nr:4Fe-4S dicluster domain-containing protein [Thermodesulfobacteriota bacterium]